MRKYLAYMLILLGIGMLVGVLYAESPSSSQTRTFSTYTLLTSSWEKYKDRFVNQDGRVVDSAQSDVTTSEGQSYALLQAVWVDDKQAFDRVWGWTKGNLKRPGDNLFGWRWGKRQDGNYGFLENGGDNSASDADTDIALSLILASDRWNKSEYLDEAKKIIPDIWKVDTDVVLGKRYLVAGNWAKSPREIVINPSYFAPYAWRLFGKIDLKNNWASLIDPAYKLLVDAGQNQLGQKDSAGLPPDWLAINRTTGFLQDANVEGLTTNYSYDAMRIPWRIALDYMWSKDEKAKDYLTTLRKLGNDYNQTNKLPTSYAHDGSILNADENPVMYATSLGYFGIAKPDEAKKIYQDKIINLYSNDTNAFRDDLPYYERNWLWFGAALYNQRLVKF